MSRFIDPALEPILEAMSARPAIDYAAMPIAEARAAFAAAAAVWTEPVLPMHDVADLAIAGQGGPLSARLYRPSPDSSQVIVFVHGGGWTFGSVDTHDVEMRALAAASGAAVLGINYRLAPEHPYPAPLEDVLSALSFIGEGGLGPGLDTGRIALAGDSAGANLALAALRAHPGDEAPRLAAAALFYGCYVPDFATESHRRFGDGRFGLTTSRMRWYWQNFAGGCDLTSTDAAIEPADLAGLPPLYLVGAGLDPLLDDTLDLSRHLAAAGSEYRLDVVPGVTHGFLHLARELPVARRVFRDVGDYLKERMNIRHLGGEDHEA